MEERLQKILSRAGIASRRAAEQIMAEGRITVNGKTVKEPGTKADLQTDDVRVDGVRVKAPLTPVYLVLNKPKGVVTTRNDPERRQTVMDLVPAVAGLFPIGRLDVTTEGLILLTNDGAFAERVAHPRYETPRVYLAKVRSIPDAATFERMRKGVLVEGDRLAVDRVRLVESDKNSWVELTLHEGKHHEVRRLLEAVGHPVSKLQRVSVGPVTLKGLAVGQYRSLTPQEIQGLLKPPSKRPPARSERPSPVRRGSGPRGRAEAPPERGADRPPVRGRRPEDRGHGTSASRGGQPNRPPEGRGSSAGRGSYTDRDSSADRGSSAGRGKSSDRSSSSDRGSSSGRGSTAGRGKSTDRGSSTERDSSADRGSSTDRVWAADRGSSAGRGSSSGRGSTAGRGSSAGRGKTAGRGSSAGRGTASGRGSSAGRGSSGGRGRGPSEGRGSGAGKARGRGRTRG